MVGLVTTGGPGGANANVRHLLIAARLRTGTASTWWVRDNTASQETPHFAGAPTGTTSLLNAAWTTTSGVANRYFAIPNSRSSHGLIDGNPAGAWSGVSPANLIGTYSGGTSGSLVLLPWFTAFATAPANTATAFLSDRTTNEKAAAGAGDVRAESAWSFDSDSEFYPLAWLRVQLDAREAGHAFTVHGRTPDAPAQRIKVIAQPDSAGAILSFVLGAATEFSVTRDAEDGAASQPTAPAEENTWYAGSGWYYPAAAYFPATPHRASALEWHYFRINARTRPNHEFAVSMSDGYVSTFGPEGSAAGTTYASSEEIYGMANNLPVHTFWALIDPTAVVTLHDLTDGTQIGVSPDGYLTDWFDGWAASLPVPVASSTITLRLAASHLMDLFRLRLPNGWVGYLGASGLGSGSRNFLSLNIGEGSTVEEGLDDMASYSLNYSSVSFTHPAPDETGPFVLDALPDNLLVARSRDGILPGFNDLTRWFDPPRPVALQISSSRHGHRLIVRHPNGEFYPIRNGSLAGSTSAPAGLPSWYQSYYYFDATALARTEMPWYVEDVDTGERLGFAVGQRRPPNSALIGWIAVPSPHLFANQVDAEYGSLNLWWSLSALGVNEGRFEIERQLSGQPWQIIGTVTANIADAADWLHFYDNNPVIGSLNSYRVRFVFGAGQDLRRSAPSNPVVFSNWLDSDGDSIPNWWEILFGLDPYDYWDSYLEDHDGDGLYDWEEFRLGFSPLTADSDGDGVPDGLEDRDEDGLPDVWELRFFKSPTAADRNLDSDGDGLSNIEEWQYGTNPKRKDSDGDLLEDSWEINRGLNPNDATGNDGRDGDPDEDGLTNLEEVIYGTHPHDADTDEDGTLDGAEAGGGGNPADPADAGEAPPAEEMFDVPFQVGDPSGSHSERWRMKIKGNGVDTRTINFEGREFGTMDDRTFKLRRGSTYEITLEHIDTDPVYLEENDVPDYDWASFVNGLPAGSGLDDANHYFVVQSNNTIGGVTSQATWIAVNTDGLLTTEQHGNNDNLTVGKKAFLLPVEVKLVDRDDPTKKWADAVDGSGKKIYAGETTGDMVSWKLGGTDSWSSMNFSWSAEGPNSQTIQGPSGTGKNEWEIADGDEDTANDWLKWKPGKWKIKVQIGSSTAEFEQQIGWRTEDYAVIGQIVQTHTHNNDKPGTLGSAWQFRRAVAYDVAPWFGNDVQREAAALLPIPPEIFTGAWVAYWGLLMSHEATPQGPFTSGTTTLPILGQVSVGEVISGHRFWMVQTGLNMAPDDPKAEAQFAASDLTTIQQAREFRVMHRYQAKFLVDDSGKVSGKPLMVGAHIADKGVTKVGFALTADQLYPGSPPFGPVTFPLMEPEDNEYNHPPKNEPVSTDKTKLSGYATARIGPTGRNVNWRLFGKDAPWIFSEIVHEVKPDRTVETTHRTSVDITWRAGSIVEGNVQFNNLNIYKAKTRREDDGAFFVDYERLDLLEMEGKLEPFINSASGQWPEADIPPSVH